MLIYNDDKKAGGNKLRTYRNFKTNFFRENYLFTDIDKVSITTFVKLRISNSNLDINGGWSLVSRGDDL